MGINWDKVQSDAESIQRTPREETQSDRDTSMFLRIVEPGAVKLRIIPQGNDIEELPYKIIKRHELPAVSSNGKKYTIFVLCWQWIMENRAAIATPLANAQKLTKADVALCKRYGCPICNAVPAMMEGGITKETYQRLFTSTKIIWNVINRADEEKVYVWTSSKTVGGTVIAAIKDFVDEGLNPLDTRKGYDWHMDARGINQFRRYQNGHFSPIPKPLLNPKKQTDPDSVRPHDLTEIAMMQFLTYQETIEALQTSMGNALARIGYSVPGDKNEWPGEQGADEEFDGEHKVFGKQKKIKREDYAKPESEFDRAVPPSDEDENTSQVKLRKKRISEEVDRMIGIGKRSNNLKDDAYSRKKKLQNPAKKKAVQPAWVDDDDDDDIPF